MSPGVDAAAAVVVGAIAVDAVRHVGERAELPLAALPVILAVHQLIEVVVWWGIDGTVASAIGVAAVYAYLLVAFGLPLLVPSAVIALEPDADRRRLMARLAVIGALVALVLLTNVVTGPVSAADGGFYVDYHARLFHGTTLTVIYVVATLGCCLASSHRFIVVFGLVNLVGVLALGWLTLRGFVSLWCAWAAVTSLIIAMHLRGTGPAQPAQGESLRR
ncbi:MAG: DUF6629 family protein [Acidimicrobiales bacterium]